LNIRCELVDEVISIKPPFHNYSSSPYLPLLGAEQGLDISSNSQMLLKGKNPYRIASARGCGCSILGTNSESCWLTLSDDRNDKTLDK
jgi:hypothetical protein